MFCIGASSSRSGAHDPHPVTVPNDYTVEEAAEVLLTRKLSGLPVVDRKGRLVGIITQTDMFRVIISMSGIGARGIQYREIYVD